jgi:hypothetical protein
MSTKRKTKTARAGAKEESKHPLTHERTLLGVSLPLAAALAYVIIASLYVAHTYHEFHEHHAAHAKKHDGHHEAFSLDQLLGMPSVLIHGGIALVYLFIGTRAVPCQCQPCDWRVRLTS